MTGHARICAIGFVTLLSACSFQLPTPASSSQDQPSQPASAAPPAPRRHSAQQAKKEPKPEPTPQDLFDYIRGELLALSPSDGINDNQEVTFDPAKSVLSITQPDGRCDIFLANVDTNSALWEVFDSSDSHQTREKILRLTLTSVSGKPARTCYNTRNQVDASIPGNRARLLFSLDKANAVRNFTASMNKAVQKLVEQCGGAAQKDLYLGK